MSGRCGRCGAPGSPSGRSASCASCQFPASVTVPDASPLVAAAWLPAAERGRADRNLAAILRGYRRAGALTQQQLADMLGYDRTYIWTPGRRPRTGGSSSGLPPLRCSPEPETSTLP